MILRSIQIYDETSGCCGGLNLKKTAKNSHFQIKIHFLSQKLPLNLTGGTNIDIFSRIRYYSMTYQPILAFNGEIATCQAQIRRFLTLENKLPLNFDSIFTRQGLFKRYQMSETFLIEERLNFSKIESDFQQPLQFWRYLVTKLTNFFNNFSIFGVQLTNPISPDFL